MYKNNLFVVLIILVSFVMFFGAVSYKLNVLQSRIMQTNTIPVVVIYDKEDVVSSLAIELSKRMKNSSVEEVIATANAICTAHNEYSSIGIDASLLCAITTVESAWAADALSFKGARGLMQLMPATAKEYMLADGVSDSDILYVPYYNIGWGSNFLADRHSHYMRLGHEVANNFDLSLAHYFNGGPPKDDREQQMYDRYRSRIQLARIDWQYILYGEVLF